MSNLLAEAIDCDDGDRAAKIIQDALGNFSKSELPAIIRRVGRIRAAPLRCLEDGFRPSGRAW
jgi:hypothetical protein